MPQSEPTLNTPALTPATTCPTDTRRRTPSQRRSRHRLRAILDAASELIVDHGLEAVTTKSVAERAGVPIGSVYYLFPDKFAIYRELLIEANAKMQERAGAARPFDPRRWREWFDEGLRNLGEFYDQERAFAALNRALRHVPGFREIDVAGNRVFEARIEEALATLLPDMTTDKRACIARTCVAIGDRLLQESLEVEGRAGREEIISEARRAIVAYVETYVSGRHGAAGTGGRRRA